MQPAGGVRVNGGVVIVVGAIHGGHGVGIHLLFMQCR
jgi:hypothetical protein